MVQKCRLFSEKPSEIDCFTILETKKNLKIRVSICLNGPHSGKI
jgi:hypothetical protein